MEEDYTILYDGDTIGTTNDEDILVDGEENYGYSDGTYEYETQPVDDLFYDDYHFDDVAGFFILGTLLVCWFIAMVCAIIKIIGLWKIFKKANRGGWEAIIPIYSDWVLFEITGYPGWFSLFVLIPGFGPIIMLVFSILAKIRLTKAFNKSDGFAVGLILLEVVFYPILGFDKSKYHKLDKVEF
jgi:hypothetical protein